MPNIQLIRFWLCTSLCDVVRYNIPQSGNLPGTRKEDAQKLLTMRKTKAGRRGWDIKERIEMYDEYKLAHMGFGTYKKVDVFGMPYYMPVQYGHGSYEKTWKTKTIREKVQPSVVWRRDKMKHKDSTPVTKWESLESNVKNALKFKIGNCGELAQTALLVLKMSEFLKKLKLVAGILSVGKPSNDPFSTADHAMVLIWPSEKNNIIPAILDWNTICNKIKEAIICDPWVWRTCQLNNKFEKDVYTSMVKAMGLASFYGGNSSYKMNLSYITNVGEGGFSLRHSVQKKKDYLLRKQMDLLVKQLGTRCVLIN
ncbi:MAG: hypothetical protein GY839_11355 [candidate division Zixibacteria bacterium]|nr:hypothetical protein [candidate division Zixibacteria bacterium]